MALTDAPLYRQLGLGSIGEDVQMLEQWLASAGLLDPARVDGRFDSDTREAVIELNRKRGEVIQELLPLFSPSSVVWSKDEFEPSVIELAVGDPAPSLGSVVASGSAGMEMIAIESPSGESLQLNGEWEWRVADTVIGVITDGEPSYEQVNLAVAIAAQGSAGSDEMVRVSSLFRALTTNRAWSVPVGTVITASDQTCLFVEEGDDFHVFATSVVGGDFGRVWIEPAPPAGTRVLANPLQILPGLTCTS